MRTVFPKELLALINGVTYDYHLGNGVYRMNTLGEGNFKIYVAGDAILWVYSNIAMSGTDEIRYSTSMLRENC